MKHVPENYSRIASGERSVLDRNWRNPSLFLSTAWTCTGNDSTVLTSRGSHYSELSFISHNPIWPGPFMLYSLLSITRQHVQTMQGCGISHVRVSPNVHSRMQILPVDNEHVIICNAMIDPSTPGPVVSGGGVKKKYTLYGEQHSPSAGRHLHCTLAPAKHHLTRPIRKFIYRKACVSGATIIPSWISKVQYPWLQIATSSLSIAQWIGLLWLVKNPALLCLDNLLLNKFTNLQISMLIVHLNEINSFW